MLTAVEGDEKWATMIIKEKKIFFPMCPSCFFFFFFKVEHNKRIIEWLVIGWLTCWLGYCLFLSKCKLQRVKYRERTFLHFQSFCKTEPNLQEWLKYWTGKAILFKGKTISEFSPCRLSFTGPKDYSNYIILGETCYHKIWWPIICFHCCLQRCLSISQSHCN